MLRELAQMACSWAKRDRIRALPSDGRLMNLRVGDQALIDERLFEVIQRDVGLEDSSSEIDYLLAEEDARFHLQVNLKRQTALLSRHNTSAEESFVVFAERIVVLSDWHTQCQPIENT